MSKLFKTNQSVHYVPGHKREIPIDSRILAFTFPEIKVKKLANNLKILMIERSELPKIYFRVAFDYGQKNDSENKAGLAQLLAATIKKGSDNMTYNQMVDEIEQVGGELDVLVNEDIFLFYGEFLSEHIEVGFKLLKDIILHPNFPLNQVEKERHKLIADLENEQSSPQFLAHRRMEKVLFKNHPYGIHKSKDTLKNITRDDLFAQHTKYFRPNNMTLILAGDISEIQAEEFAQTYFSNWIFTNSESVRFEKPGLHQERLICLINRPGSEQSNILLGNLLFERNHPDYIPMLVMNKILGGGGSARLFLHLREEKGYTYGAYSNLETFLKGGIWYANAEVRTEVTAKAIEAFLDQFNRIKMELVSDAELQNAQRYLIGSFPLKNETPASIAALALQQHLFELPEDYWSTYTHSIGDVSQSVVQKMAQKYIKEEEMIFVVVGDSKKIKNDLKRFGPVLDFDLEDNQIN